MDLAYSYSLEGGPLTELPVEGWLLEGLAPGNIELLVAIEDVCGNVEACTFTLLVADCQAPDPNCAPLEVVYLNNTGTLTLQASDLVPNPTDNCPDNLTVSFSADPNDQMRELYCRDAAEPLLLTVFVTDEAGNQASCLVPVFVEDPYQVCREISGFITTEWGEPLSGVLVNIKGSEEWTLRTENDGFYSILLPAGGSYLIRPCADGGWSDGLNSSDGQVLQNYLAAGAVLSPYQVLSADIDNNSQVNFLDLLAIQQLSAGSPDANPANRSWRFFQSAYSFTNPENPFIDPVPESYSLTNLSQAQLELSFIGVKIGNVDGALSSPNLDLSALSCSPGLGKCGGQIYWDQNGNCIPDNPEDGLGNWLVSVHNTLDTFYQLTSEEGAFQFTLSPGTYQVEVFNPNAAWGLCQNSYSVSVGPDGIAFLTIGAQSASPCPWPVVDLATGPLQVCDSVQLAISYANLGTQSQAGAYLEVVLDPAIDLLGASHPYLFQNDTLIFPLGTLSVGERGQIWVDGFLDCSTQEGLSHCSEARIYPENSCLPAGPTYDGSILEINQICQLDSLEFQIRNIGEPMDQPAFFIVIEDEMIMRDGSVQLVNNEVASVRVPANGSTYRMEVNQHPDFPGPSFPSLTVEACGQNANGGVSTGFVTQFSTEEGLPDRAVSCRQNTNSVPLIEKQGFPVGYQAPHYIAGDRKLEYQMHYRDPAYQLSSLLVIDTLAEPFDLFALQASVASHPYEYTLLPNGALAFFLRKEAGIARRDWFVQFGIYPKPGLPDGTILENSAAFYPSVGSSLVSNTTFHTIGTDFIEWAPDPNTTATPTSWFVIKPNPITEEAYGQVFQFAEENKRFCLYNSQGQLVKETQSDKEIFQLPVNNLPAGAYFYRLFIGAEAMLQGKIMIQ